jgi:hypothetical protein
MVSGTASYWATPFESWNPAPFFATSVASTRIGNETDALRSAKLADGRKCNRPCRVLANRDSMAR